MRPPQKSSRLLPYFQQFKTTKVRPFSYRLFERQLPPLIEGLLRSVYQFESVSRLNVSDSLQQQLLNNYESLQQSGRRAVFSGLKMKKVQVDSLQADKVAVSGEFECVFALAEGGGVAKGSLKPKTFKFAAEVGNDMKIEALKASILDCNGQLGYE